MNPAAQIRRDGAAHIKAGSSAATLREIEKAAAGPANARAGSRLAGNRALAALLAPEGPIGRFAAEQLGSPARPVRAVMFNKTAALNWSLGWHQDRTIAVRERIETPGFSNWTTKAGIQHVEPPFALIERMLTLRLHLDPVDSDNAPLLIAPGSHRSGLIREAEIDRIVGEAGAVRCLAGRGDIWLYATPILHASKAAARPRRRRVLQVDYSGDSLPAPLCWLGI
jgi:hypothetical protein